MCARNHKFIIPYLSSDVIELLPTTAGLLRVKLAIRFIGLPPPSYVYHLLVVAFLNQFTDPRYKIRAAKNGALVHHGQKMTILLHNHNKREVLLYSDTPVDQLESCWKQAIDVLEAVIKNLKSVWVAAHPVCKFFCAHCIYTGEEKPDCDTDPDWYTPPSDPATDPPLRSRLRTFPGVEPVECLNARSNGGSLVVPSPLRYPSKYFYFFGHIK